ncbi:MAG: family 20 glycosylhydrolase [Sediminibacterium sp.]
MKKHRSILLLIFLTVGKSLLAQLPIIPYPNKVVEGKGFYTVTSSVAKEAVIVIDSSAASVVTNSEGYLLTVTPKQIKVLAKTKVGAFYGMQTLLQLEVASKKIPVLTIEDAPAFGYRGLMLDVGRHFMPITFIKQLLDVMAMQKMNNLHLHLTEDQGWRIEIKKYPKLTSVGSVRGGTLIGKYPGTGNTNTPYGGYYTQAQLKELVAYAAAKHINIVPEIEMPGHASAAIAAYPELSCFPSEPTKLTNNMYASATENKIKTLGGKIVQETWGVFDDVFAPSEFTFNFIEHVLDEVMDIFPSSYIHIGGDECPKTAWKRSSYCQSLMKEKGIANEHALQSYFIQRVEKYVNSKGRKIIGWDEILEGGLAPNATVMSWQGEEGGITAAKQHHDVIMTPQGTCYLNFYQSSDPRDSIAFGGFLPIEAVYNYSPVPAALTPNEASYIKGVQGNLWTEYIANKDLASFMLYPRAMAIAENGWTKTKTGFDHFTSRVTRWQSLLQQKGLHYSDHLYNVQITSKPIAGGINVSIGGVGKAYKIVYNTNGKLPSVDDQVYTGPISITGDAKLQAGVVVNNKITDVASAAFSINKATGAKLVSLLNAPKAPYNKSGNTGFINGILANDSRFSDGEWLAWEGKTIHATLDLGAATSVTQITTRFINSRGSWIHLPTRVEVLGSLDGKTFTRLGLQQNFDNSKEGALTVSFALPPTTIKFLTFIADPVTTIPAGFAGAGNPSWLFMDELIIK